MPRAQIGTVVVEVLVVLPDADDGWHELHLARCVGLDGAGLLAPLAGRVETSVVLIEPIAVKDRKVDRALVGGARQLAQHGAVREQRPADRAAAGVLIVPASELEAEVEAPLGIVLGH